MQAPWKTPVEIKYLLEEMLGVQVLLDNDCVMLALAEKWQNPAANGDNPRARATQISFGQLNRAQQLMGIGYLYVESQLSELS